MEYLSLSEVAKKLHVSRRRAQALVERGQLPAHRIGGRWLVEAGQVHQRRRVVPKRGRPLKESTSWHVLDNAILPRDAKAQDEFRRLVLTRAIHRHGFVHPSALGEIRRDNRYVRGGRDAAEDAGLPVGIVDDELDVYLSDDGLETLLEEHVVRFDTTRPNLHVHVFENNPWPLRPGLVVVPLLIAWLDLADRGDRAERLIREFLLMSQS